VGFDLWPRWQRDDGSFVPPDTLLHCETSGLIISLDLFDFWKKLCKLCKRFT